MSILTEEALDKINIRFDNIIKAYENLIGILIEEKIIEEAGWFSDPIAISENMNEFNEAMNSIFANRNSEDKLKKYYESLYAFIIMLAS